MLAVKANRSKLHCSYSIHAPAQHPTYGGKDDTVKCNKLSARPPLLRRICCAAARPGRIRSAARLGLGDAAGRYILRHATLGRASAAARHASCEARGGTKKSRASP